MLGHQRSQLRITSAFTLRALYAPLPAGVEPRSSRECAGPRDRLALLGGRECGRRYAQRPAEGRMISVTQVRARFQVREIITVPERWAAFDDAVFVGKVRVGVPPLMPDSIRVPLGMKCFHPGKEYCHDSAA